LTNSVEGLKLDADTYNDSLDADDQISTEEDIASMIFTADTENEETCQTLGQGILKLVLKRFRPDLFAKLEP